MDYILLARCFGLITIILSLGILFNLEDARNMAKNLVNSETGYILGGVLPVIFGSWTLLVTGSFALDWQLVVNIVGLGMLIIGIFRCVFVNQWKALMIRHLDQIPFLFSLFGLMLGVVLIYVGFMANSFDTNVS